MRTLLFCILFVCMGTTHAADKDAFNYSDGKACTDESCVVVWVVECVSMVAYVGGKNSMAAAIYHQLPGTAHTINGFTSLHKSSKKQGMVCLKEYDDSKDLYMCYTGLNLVTDKPMFIEDTISSDAIFDRLKEGIKGGTDVSRHSPFDGCYDASKLE